MNEYIHELNSGDYFVNFGVDGSKYDSKPMFPIYLEKGKTYRITFRVSLATQQKYVFDMFEFETLKS